mgnify:FL=1|tara:strand:+ start:1039 stop:2790 length:1752 start_codon:yes stop_codon:yes gene_type:complete
MAVPEKKKELTRDDLFAAMGVPDTTEETSTTPTKVDLTRNDLFKAMGGSEAEPTIEKGVDASLPELVGKGLLYGVEKVGAGLQGLGRSAITDITGIDVISDFAEMRVEQDQNYADYIDSMTDWEHKAFWLGGHTGETASLLAALPARTPTAIVAGSAIIGASEPTQDTGLISQERTMNMLIAANSGMLPDALLNTGKFLVGKAANVYKYVSKSGGRQAAVEGVTEDAVKEAIDSADRLGIKLTPAEATANQVILTREATALGGLNEERSLKALELKIQRDRELADTIGDFVEGILPEGREVAKSTLNTLYDRAFKTRMSTPFLERLEKNGIYKAAEESLLSDPAKAANFSSLEKGSLGQVEMIRREISNKAHAAATSIDSTQRQKASALRSVNKGIKQALRNADEAYAEALPIAQRQIAQKRIMEELSKVPTKASQKGTSIYNATPNQFYDTILSTPEKRNELSRQLKEVGGSSQAIDDLSFILARIKNTPFNALKAKGSDGINVATMGMGKEGIAIFNTIGFIKGRHNQAMLDVVTDGKWQNSLKKVRKIKDPVKQREALSTALAYITATTIADATKEEEEQ